MIVFDKCYLQKKHRTLVRTEQSIEKTMRNNPNTHLKRMRRLMHLQLKDCSIRQSMLNTQANPISFGKINENKKRTRIKSSSSLSIFKLAHSVTSQQSFLTTIKSKKKLITENILKTQGSQKNIQTNALLKSEVVQQQKKNDFDSEVEFKTIDRNNWTTSIKKNGTHKNNGQSEPIQYHTIEPIQSDLKQNSNLLKDMNHRRYSKHNRVYSQNSQNLRSQEEQVSTVKKMNELSDVKDKNKMILNVKMANVPKKQSHQKLTLINGEQPFNSPERQEFQQIIHTQNKIIVNQGQLSSPLNRQSYPSLCLASTQGKAQQNQNDQREITKIKNMQIKQSNKNHYLQPDSIDQSEIQVVAFISPSNKHKQFDLTGYHMSKSILKNPYLPLQSAKQTIQVNKNQLQPSIQTKTDQKKKEIKIKSTHELKLTEKQNKLSKQIENPKSNQHLLHQVKQQQTIEITKTSNKTEKYLQQQKQESQLNLNNMNTEIIKQTKYSNHANNLSKVNEEIENKQRQRETVKQLMTKINQIKKDIEMMAELTAFFSQNSKLFKEDKDLEQYYREKRLKWHKFVFLSFKYCYYCHILFEKFYTYCSSFININQKQLNDFSIENKSWHSTLIKIQNSVRKNIQVNNNDTWLSLDIILPKSNQILNVIKEIFMEKKGSSEIFKYIKELSVLIFEQGAKLMKSVYISKVVSSYSKPVITIKEGLFRIINCCIILSSWMEPKILSTKPIIQDIKLQNPSLQLFKLKYNVLIQQIFSSK